MPRIKIKDLPKDKKLTRRELRQVLGGTTTIASIASEPPTTILSVETVTDGSQTFNTATQYTNLLSSVLKTQNEMQSGIIRNTR